MGLVKQQQQANKLLSWGRVVVHIGLIMLTKIGG
jgi:hypothetical protein